MRDTLKDFNELDAQVIAIDPHESWSAKFMLKDAGFPTDAVNFPLLMDPTHTVSATYGVAFQMRIHVEWSNRPATFVIDRDGVIRYEKRATTFGDRPTPLQIVDILKSLDQ